MNRTFIGMLGSLGLLAGLLFLLSQGDSPRRGSGSGTEPIMLYCAASNRAVIEAIRDDYQKEYKRRVEIQYGASQTLLSSVEVSKTGDLFLPADDSYIDIGYEKELLDEVFPLAQMKLVVAVPKGNPKDVKSLKDLMSDGFRFVQANPDAAAVGKLTKEILQKSGQWDALDAATIGYRTTVTDVANDIVVGAADAGVVYDAVLNGYPDLDFVELPEFEDGTANIAVSAVKHTRNPAAALHFARYLSADDRGQKRYKEFGFRPAGGDPWKDTPELSIYAGAMLQPAIEKSLIEFEQREGVNIARVYNGCGILVAQMKAGQHPDAYFACDAEFMQQVKENFAAPITVSENELVILVKKGNPLGIKSLRDLTKPDLRVGIGHEKQCAMGWLTQQTLSEGGILKEVMANVITQLPTGDMLVNELKIGSLDAAVAYLSNAAGSQEKLDAVRITGIECSHASQPFAIAKETLYSHLTDRLLRKLQSAESKQRFLDNGFVWKVD